MDAQIVSLGYDVDLATGDKNHKLTLRLADGTLIMAIITENGARTIQRLLSPVKEAPVEEVPTRAAPILSPVRMVRQEEPDVDPFADGGVASL